MERIKLTKREKYMLLALRDGKEDYFRKKYGEHYYQCALYGLASHRLIRIAKVEGGRVESAGISAYGHYYLQSNPSLSNPVDWQRIGFVVFMLLCNVFCVSALVIKIFIK